ncbi:DUF4283 domain-containing protein [Artemisia annua]|uniref:DUF4283 domain-containing protein n=1 Tax=Artemisia annua TaxID=35608 RepID=A0A2U1Q052_ARTAN|nr:DUF4283 domain-containing protein [Artemisia annua]
MMLNTVSENVDIAKTNVVNDQNGTENRKTYANIMGCKKWELTACGYFVGYKMYMMELKYHLFRMWGKFGLKSIMDIGNGTFVFKFSDEQGLNTVIENGVWIVNNKAMVIQRWDASVDLNKVELDVLPIWVKFVNLPLEAWTAKGLSAIASRLGKPVMMDSMTTKMCSQGVGRLGYARVLVEVDAKKGIPDHVDIMYCDKMGKQTAVKKVKVEYDWKPHVCVLCKVFGHNHEKCKLNVKEKENIQTEKVNGNVVTNKDKNGDKNSDDTSTRQDISARQNNQSFASTSQNTPKKGWKVQENVISELRKSANKYSVLQENDEESGNGNDESWKSVIKNYVLLKQKPSSSVTSKWNKQMHQFYQEKWNAMYGMVTDDIELDENDVFVDKSATAKFMTENEVHGILETHMKKERIQKIGDRVFGNWSWQHNLQVSRKGCRIMVGWDNDKVQCSLVHYSEQNMLYYVEVVNSPVKFYCTFIYAANSGRNMKELWNDLIIYKHLINSEAWVPMGDVNVSLNVNDHSEGGSSMSQDMIDFQDCVNTIEVEEIGSSGFHYTWTKSLLNPDATEMKTSIETPW